VEDPREQLEADDGVDDDDEEHQEGDVEQRHHRFEDGVQDDLQTWKIQRRNLISRAPLCFGRYVKPLVPAVFAVVRRSSMVERSVRSASDRGS
jgi:hypothetical protein